MARINMAKFSRIPGVLLVLMQKNTAINILAGVLSWLTQSLACATHGRNA